jgi:hypothetical protein
LVSTSADDSLDILLPESMRKFHQVNGNKIIGHERADENPRKGAWNINNAEASEFSIGT